MHSSPLAVITLRREVAARYARINRLGLTARNAYRRLHEAPVQDLMAMRDAALKLDQLDRGRAALMRDLKALADLIFWPKSQEAISADITPSAAGKKRDFCLLCAGERFWRTSAPGPSATAGERARRQQDDRPQQLEHPLDCDPDQPERQQQQPYQRVQHQRHQRQRPAHHQEQQPQQEGDHLTILARHATVAAYRT
jgi:hypothetical protein